VIIVAVERASGVVRTTVLIFLAKAIMGAAMSHIWLEPHFSRFGWLHFS